MTNIEKTKKLIEENLYLTMAVATKTGKPWTANIYYAYDKDYNFYWYSQADTLHSKYIEENPEVAISIFDSTAVGDNVDAIYIRNSRSS